MSNNHGSAPCVTDSSLLFCIDPANKGSWPNTGGYDVYDISGNDHHAVSHPSSGGMTWQPQNSGRFYFDGSGGSTMLVTSTMTTGTNGVTFEVWMYRISNANALFIWDARSGIGTYMITNYLSYNINWGQVARYNDPGSYQDNSNLFDRWVHFVAVYISNEVDFYINGANVFNNALVVDDDIGANLAIGTSNTYSWHFYGYMGLFRIYNRYLSGIEVLQNFNATRWRFGV